MKISLYKNINRTMFGRAIKNVTKLTKPPLQDPRHAYAVHKAHNKPGITDGDNDSQNNNPPVKTVAYVKGTPKTVYTRHPEIASYKCNVPGCQDKVCFGYCAKPSEEKAKAVAHITHDKDLNDDEREESIVPYTIPHETSGKVNEEKTKVLKQEDRLTKLEKILKNKNDEDKHEN